MKDKLSYIIIGVLVGVVIMQLNIDSRPGVPRARASYVGDIYGIVAIKGNSFLVEDGSVWEFSWEHGWRGPNYVSLPIPTDEIKFWDGDYFISTSNELWAYNRKGDIYPHYLEWHNWGSYPGAQPIPTEKQSWGSIKGKLGN